jgi:hypothetical protein
MEEGDLRAAEHSVIHGARGLRDRAERVLAAADDWTLTPQKGRTYEHQPWPLELVVGLSPLVRPAKVLGGNAWERGRVPVKITRGTLRKLTDDELAALFAQHMCLGPRGALVPKVRRWVAWIAVLPAVVVAMAWPPAAPAVALAVAALGRRQLGSFSRTLHLEASAAAPRCYSEARDLTRALQRSQTLARRLVPQPLLRLWAGAGLSLVPGWETREEAELEARRTLPRWRHDLARDGWAGRAVDGRTPVPSLYGRAAPQLDRVPPPRPERAPVAPRRPKVGAAPTGKPAPSIPEFKLGAPRLQPPPAAGGGQLAE